MGDFDYRAAVGHPAEGKADFGLAGGQTIMGAARNKDIVTMLSWLVNTEGKMTSVKVTKDMND
jgi:hypothetical protein